MSLSRQRVDALVAVALVATLAAVVLMLLRAGEPGLHSPLASETALAAKKWVLVVRVRRPR